jgi:hypothetical protein
MKMQKTSSRQGFTLIEANAAIMLIVIALGLAVGGFMFVLKNTNEGDVQSELDIDVQIAMERLKMDLRLSSLDDIFYYPAGPGPYSAISFPLAQDDDGDGLFELEADGSIIWDNTVIYHIWPGSPHQLRVTTFSNRDNLISDTERQLQLDNVVKTGDGSASSIPNNDNASTRTLFENLLDWMIRPNQSIYDAYSDISERETTSLGFALISDGPHTFEFRVAGKNDASEGYRIGLDQLTVSPSYSPREAEAQEVTAQSGASAVSQYMGIGSWKGNHQLNFPATGPGASFTLTMDNDRWQETNFGAVGYVAEDTEFVFDETLNPKDFVVQLRGNDITWEALQQTEAIAGTSTSNNTLKGKTVAVHINGSELLTNGNWIVYNGRKCQLTFQASAAGKLQVGGVRIAKTASLEETVWAVGEPLRFVRFGGLFDSPVMDPGTTATSDWLDYEINTTNNYLVVFTIKNDAAKCYPMSWKNLRLSPTDDPDCLIASGGITTNHIIGLSSITASYPEKGTYTSQIFDTRLGTPAYGDISWDAEVPVGTTLRTKVRSGSLPDLSDASDWAAISSSSVNPRSVSASYNRYIQFQAGMTSSLDGLSTPKLQDLDIEWAGDMQLVNIGGTFTKGPDYGIVEVLVDGMPLQSALSIDLMIYKDIAGLEGKAKRVTSSLVADIRPRNTGK